MRYLKQEKEQSDLVKRALAMLQNGAPNPEPASIQSQGADLATTILTEAEPDEAGAILAAWKRLFDLNLDRERVTRHLAQLRASQGRRTRS